MSIYNGLLHRCAVVAQTKIEFNEKELLQLIHEHLAKKGLTDTAAALQREAGLPTTTPRSLPSPWPCNTPVRVPRPIATANSPASVPANVAAANTSSASPSLSQTPPTAPTTAATSVTSTPPPTVLPETPRPTFSLRKHRTPVIKVFSDQPKAPALQKPHHQPQPSPLTKKMDTAVVPSKAVTLESIVTEYLRKQHALCKNPIVICPPFDLFTPHRCPEPLNRNSAPLNLAKRIGHRQIEPRFGGLNGRKFDRKCIYSKFRPVKTYRDENNISFTACAFSYVDTYLFCGTASGEMIAYNYTTGAVSVALYCALLLAVARCSARFIARTREFNLKRVCHV